MRIGDDTILAGDFRSHFVRSAVGLVAGLTMAVLAGCQTASLEDAAPKTVPNKVSETADDGAKQTAPAKIGVAVLSPIPVPFNQPEKVARKDFVDTGIASNGKFPNLGTERTAALPQLSAAEASAMKQEFKSLEPKGANGAQTEAAYRRRLAELRKLAKTHASDTDAEITK